MDFLKDKKILITKTWKNCKSLSLKGMKTSRQNIMTKKSKSANAATSTASSMLAAAASIETHAHAKRPKAPGGCFFVYVGPEKQRFVVRAKYANHPLFMVLLEEAESEYGYHSDGPILLPCSVTVFFKVLAEIDGDVEIRQKCSFVKNPSYHFLSPSRMVAMNQY